jgi:hypothetical protein
MVAYDVFHRQCCDFIRLQAWYVWHLHVQRGVPRESIFGNQLVRFLYEPRGLPNEAAWQAQHDLILDACRRHSAAGDTGELEETILAQVRAFIDDRYLAEVLYARYQADYRKAAPCGGFTHDVGGDRLTLHFTNTFDPDTPFRHLPELRRGLARLLSEARAQQPGLLVAYCGTWLNSVPRFADLFPAAWRANAETAPPAGHSGWWGQFTDRTGALHRENAAYLRQNGTFRFPHLRCACSAADLERHLAESEPRSPPGQERVATT